MKFTAFTQFAAVKSSNLESLHSWQGWSLCYEKALQWVHWGMSVNYTS